jgi:hypothetical protein
VFAQLGLQSKFEIFPKWDHEFFWKVVDAQATFVKDAAGKVVTATHTQNRRTFSARVYRSGRERCHNGSPRPRATSGTLS